MNSLGKIVIGIALLGLPWTGRAQQVPADDAEFPSPERGAPVEEVGLPMPSEHFAPPEYGHYPQNWAVTQDNRGIIYVANYDGILEYDGASWRLIPTPSSKYVRSLVTAHDGTIYAGTSGDVGMLQPDSVGVMRYVSLYDHIPEAHQGFKDVWSTLSTPAGVYFQSNERLFRWDGSSIAAWESEEGFHTAFEVRDELYVRDFRDGLLKMVGDSLQRVPGGARFADTPVLAMVPFPGGGTLIGTSRSGLYLFDGQSIRPFETDAQPFLDAYELYHGTALSSGHAALATIGGGVLVVDPQGRLVRVLGPAAELPDGVVHHVYEDRDGGLWTSFNSSGLARAEVGSPLSKFNQTLGLEGLVYKMDRHDGTLYAATGAGLFALDTEPLTLRARQEEQYTAFRRVDTIPIAWDTESTDDGLLVATERGVFLVQAGRQQQITQGAARASRTLEASERYPGWFWVGERDGLTALHRTSRGWRSYPVAAIEEEVISVVEGPNGTVWANLAQGSIVQLRFGDTPASEPAITRLQDEKTLPDGFNRVTSVAGELLVISPRGVFTLRPQEGGPHRGADDGPSAYEVIPDERFDIEGNDGPLLGVFGTEASAVWMLRGDRVYRGVRRSNGTYEWRGINALHFPKGDETPLFIDEGGVIWMGNGREIVRYDPRPNAPEGGAFPVHVRKVTTVQDQQILYGGAQPATASEEAQPLRIEVDYEHNDLRFDFAAAHYGNVAPLEYQVRLEGRESDWSAWQSSTNAVYADLTEGQYTFYVRARAGARQAQQRAALTFRVLPPWYRTGWAYAAYIAAILVLGAGYWRYRGLVEQHKRVQQQAKELERERMANERLQEANRRLKQASELKDNFLANTSHELRTPLTTILGFADVLKEEAPEQHKEFLDIIEKSGHRLLRTLNAMLDLAKLRSGVAEADLLPLDVVGKSKEVVELFIHRARQKGIDLDLDAPDEPVRVALDDRYFEQILDNLISNAIKFTDEGRVWVEIEPSAAEVAIRVCDTGAGIDPAFMPHIFEDFKQESSGLNRDHEGNGLGLAITKRLVHLMRGTIDAESTKGEGSTFTVVFARVTGASAASSAAQPARVESAS